MPGGGEIPDLGRGWAIDDVWVLRRRKTKGKWAMAAWEEVGVVCK